MNDPLVKLEQVSFAYPGAERPALLDLSLTIARGEIVGLVGATGSGKTTLCLAMNGIVPQFYGGRFFGRLTVGGMDTLETPIDRLAQSVGIVLQDPATQVVTASVEHEVAFPLENLRLPPSEIRARLEWALAAVHLSHVARKHPHSLSGGEQQRLAIAAALALQPDLIVFDEPTSQLDPRSTIEVFDLLRKINADYGTTVLVASHAAEELASTVGRLLVLSQGRLVADGPPESIYRDTGLIERENLRPPEVTAAFSFLSARGLSSEPPPVRLEDGIRTLASLPLGRPFRPPDIPLVSRGQPILSVERLSHTYPDGTQALRDISVEIGRGDYVLLIGQNGAGKSTLVKHLLNLLTPTAGEVRMDGAPIASYAVAELARRIGYVSQNPDRQIFNATVESEVGFSLRPLRLAESEKRRRVDEALEAMDLTRMRGAHPLSLSKGDRARVVIAAVLVMDVEVLIFDEPTTGQDYHGARAILELTRLLHSRGKTIVVVTHHLYLMPEYARRVLIMGAGRLLLDAPIREAYHAEDVLEQTFLRVTQAVALARAAHPENYAISTEEFASSYR